MKRIGRYFPGMPLAGMECRISVLDGGILLSFPCYWLTGIMSLAQTRRCRRTLTGEFIFGICMSTNVADEISDNSASGESMSEVVPV